MRGVGVAAVAAQAHDLEGGEAGGQARRAGAAPRAGATAPRARAPRRRGPRGRSGRARGADHRRARTAASTCRRRWGRPAPAPRRGRPRATRRRPASTAGGDHHVVGDDHAALRVRAMAINTGAPTSAVTMPIGSSAGATIVRATASAATSSAAPPSDRRRHQRADDRGPTHAAHHVRHHQADEADRPAHRHHRADRQRHRDDHATWAVSAPDVDPEMAGLARRRAASRSSARRWRHTTGERDRHRGRDRGRRRPRPSRRRPKLPRFQNVTERSCAVAGDLNSTRPLSRAARARPAPTPLSTRSAVVDGRPSDARQRSPPLAVARPARRRTRTAARRMTHPRGQGAGRHAGRSPSTRNADRGRARPRWCTPSMPGIRERVAHHALQQRRRRWRAPRPRPRASTTRGSRSVHTTVTSRSSAATARLRELRAECHDRRAARSRARRCRTPRRRRRPPSTPSSIERSRACGGMRAALLDHRLGACVVSSRWWRWREGDASRRRGAGARGQRRRWRRAAAGRSRAGAASSTVTTRRRGLAGRRTLPGRAAPARRRCRRARPGRRDGATAPRRAPRPPRSPPRAAGSPPMR
jgi:hypothetical protein